MPSPKLISSFNFKMTMSLSMVLSFQGLSVLKIAFSISTTCPSLTSIAPAMIDTPSTDPSWKQWAADKTVLEFKMVPPQK